MDFLEYAKLQEQQMKADGRKAGEHFASAINKLVKFWKEPRLPFDRLDSRLMLEYQSYLLKDGVSPNTIGFHMRALRSIYNKAVDDGITPNNDPFEAVLTAVITPKKECLSLLEIRMIEDIKNFGSEQEEYARDLFLFSYYTGGLSLPEMAQLRKTDLANDVLTITSQPSNIRSFWRLPLKALRIIDKYKKADMCYLFPLHSTTCTLRTLQGRITSNLRSLSKRLHISVGSLTFAIAKNTFEKGCKCVIEPQEVTS